MREVREVASMNTLKTTFLLALLTVLLVMAGGAIGGQSGMLIALVFAGVMNFVSYWFSDKIVLKMYRAKEVTEAENPEFYSIVRQLTIKAGLPMPKVYIIPSDTLRMPLQPAEIRSMQRWPPPAASFASSSAMS